MAHIEMTSIPATALCIMEPAKRAIQPDLLPLFDDILTIHSGVLQALHENQLTEAEIVAFAYEPWESFLMTPADAMSLRGSNLIRLTQQYEHVRKVTGAALAFKRMLLENGAPNRIVAYQTGTGWPLPQQNHQCEEILYIPYGTGPFAEFFPVGSETDELAGVHVYRVTGNSGEELTLTVLKDRMHGYTETASPTAAYDLAFMPRVLKGIGAEFIVSSFASGVDKSLAPEGSLRKLDLAVIVANADESRLSTFLGPGTGDQRILGRIFGGPFQNIAAMRPRNADVWMLLDAMQEARVTLHRAGVTLPQLHATIQVDTAHTPNFQNAYTHAMTHATYEELTKSNVIPADLLQLLRGSLLALVHGMVQTGEREGYFQSSPFSLPTIFNRTLAELPLVAFTDFVDPVGQSQGISDEAVRKAGKEVEQFTSHLITAFFTRYADKPLGANT